jgi:hypothetical protein
VHVDTTSHRVWGEDDFPEEQELPVRIPKGDRKDKRPDLKPCVRSTLWGDRAVPMWGKPEAGHASNKPLTTTLRSAIAQLLARYGVHQGADVDIADAALVTEDNLAALGETLCITRLPATASAWGRGMAAAVAQNRGEEVAGLAQTPPTKHRPGALSQVAERGVT